MLYTNRSLEIIEENGRRKLEISNLYNREISIPIDKKVSEKLISVQGKLHKYLSLESNGRYLKLTNKNEEDLYIILDLLDYKCFRRNSVLLTLKGDKGFKTLRYYRTVNRCDKCRWGLHILEAPKREFSILKMYGTSGIEKYLTIYRGFIMMHTTESLVQYIKDYNIKFDLSSAEWELLKKEK